MWNTLVRLVRQPLPVAVQQVCEEPSYVLAQMVCAEILSAPEFKWKSDPAPPQSRYIKSRKTKAEPENAATAFLDYGYTREWKQYMRACDEATNTRRFKTKRIELVHYTPHRSYDAGMYDFMSNLPPPHIKWSACKPFGSDFNEKERKLILAAIAKAEAQQAERDRLQREATLQSRAADALAEWCGVSD